MRSIIRGGACAAVLLMAPGGLSELPATERAEPVRTARPVTVATARMAPVEEVLHAFGRVRPARIVHVPMPDRTAPVAEILVEEGDWVTRGQVIARLDAEEAQRAHDLARTDLRSARADVQAARTRLKMAETGVRERRDAVVRLSRLARTGVSSDVRRRDAERALERAILEREAVRSQLDKALARADRMGLDLARHARLLERTVLRAPVAGRLLSLEAEVGAAATAGRPLATVAEAGEMEAVLELPAGALAKVRPGDRVRLWQADDRVVFGEVARIASGPALSGGLGQVGVRLADADWPVPGTGLRGEIVVDRQPAVTVPLSAVVPLPSGPGVYRVIGDRAVATPVRLAGHAASDRAKIVEGLPDGARYVLRAGALLRDGAGLRAIPREAADAGMGAARRFAAQVPR